VWIRETGDKPDRRPTDVLKLVAGAVGTVVVGVWAQSQSSVDLHLFRVLNDEADNANGLARAFFACGSIWFVVGVALVLLLIRQVRVAWQVAAAGAAAWAVALLLRPARRRGPGG